jgi:hypothetical protein
MALGLVLFWGLLPYCFIGGGEEPGVVLAIRFLPKLGLVLRAGVSWLGVGRGGFCGFGRG